MTNHQIFLLLLLMVPHTTNTRCSKGCLSCNIKEECLFCDILQNYKLENKDCVSISANHCTRRLNSGTCYECENSYFYNSSQKQCELVSSDKLITNCEKYQSSSICSRCLPNFYISNNKCIAIESLIDFCSYYKTKITCDQC